MKKILSLCLVLCLAAIALIGGSLAYFTDTEYVENTMVSGKIDIEQSEWMRDGDTLKAYEDNQVLIPAVVYGADGKLAPTEWNNCVEDNTVSYNVTGSAVTFKMPDADRIANVKDKIVTVQNIGNNDAYVRTIVLMSCTADTSILDNVAYQYDSTYFSVDYWTDDTMTVNGTTYRVVVFTYKDALKAEGQEISRPSLQALWLNPAYNNQGFANLEVDVLSQAVQAEGFKDANIALNAAFGEVDATNLAQWLGQLPANP